MGHVEQCRKTVGRTVQSNGNDKAMKVDQGSEVATGLVSSGATSGDCALEASGRGRPLGRCVWGTS